MATATQERPTRTADWPGASWRGPSFWQAAPWLVFAVALGIGFSLFASYWAQSRALWISLDHDRSAHFELGLNLAMDIRHANVAGFLHHLDGARVWGPLHGIVLGVVQLIAGPDVRLGIVPSWCAWIATVVLGFLIARRLIPEGGTAAGVLAAMLIALSPAHRAFATDVMLESVGAALTLLCLFLYLRAVQDDDPKRGRWLGLSLTVLFLTKANYWLIVALGLGVGECLRRPNVAIERAKLALAAAPLAAKRFVNPWTALIAALGAAAAWIGVTGGGVAHLGGVKIRMTSGHNLLHLAYAIAFIRLLLWWRREGIGDRLASWSPVVRDLATWHVWPVAVYFLLPKRLGYFLWFVSPANAGGETQSPGLLRGLEFYFAGLVQDYHAFAWLPIVVLACAALGLATLSRWRGGSVAIYCFTILAILATARHPMLKYRLAHTWVAPLWILASASAVQLIVLASRSRQGPRIALASSLCLAAALIHSDHWLRPGRAQEAGVRPDAPCVLAIPETYHDALRDVRRPTLLCNVHAPFLLSWTFQEAHRHQRFATQIPGLDPRNVDRTALAAWASKKSSDAVILIDVAETSPFFYRDGGGLNPTLVRTFLDDADSGFLRADEWSLPEGVRIEMWKRSP